MQNIETMINQVEKFNQEIYDLEQTIADKKGAIVKKRNEMQELLDAEIAKEVEPQMSTKDYGCGTVNIDTGAFKIKTTVRKTVKWDEKALFEIRKKIIEAGENPSAYIKEKLSVSETAYNDFDPDIQKVFEPAREVIPSKPSIKIERKHP